MDTFKISAFAVGAVFSLALSGCVDDNGGEDAHRFTVAPVGCADTASLIAPDVLKFAGDGYNPSQQYEVGGSKSLAGISDTRTCRVGYITHSSVSGIAKTSSVYVAFTVDLTGRESEPVRMDQHSKGLDWAASAKPETCSGIGEECSYLVADNGDELVAKVAFRVRNLEVQVRLGHRPADGANGGAESMRESAISIAQLLADRSHELAS